MQVQLNKCAAHALQLVSNIITFLHLILLYSHRFMRCNVPLSTGVIAAANLRLQLNGLSVVFVYNELLRRSELCFFLLGNWY